MEILGGFPLLAGSAIHEKLRVERFARGLNLAEMARFVGVDVEIWTRLESGEYPPSSKEIEKLRKVNIELPDEIELRGNGLATLLSTELREARLKHELSQADLARLLGYKSGTSWSRIETSGRIPCPSKWGKIKELLGVEVS